MWNLLDYAASSSAAVIQPGNAGRVNVDINTQFLSPLGGNDGPTPSRHGQSTVETEDMEAFDDSLNWDTLGLSDELEVLFPTDFWTNGQL